jgi:hypothetical protein
LLIMSACSSSGQTRPESATGIGAIGPNINQYTVDLTGENPCNQQYITVTLNDVTDSAGNHSNTVTSPPWGLLIGDITDSGDVNASDITQAKAQSGAAVTASNFRNDATANGAINASDVSLVKSKSGTALPTAAPRRPLKPSQR